MERITGNVWETIVEYETGIKKNEPMIIYIFIEAHNCTVSKCWSYILEEFGGKSIKLKTKNKCQTFYYSEHS